MKLAVLFTFAVGLAVAAPAAESGANPQAASTNAFRVSIHVDAAKPLGELKPIWRFFGADEPNYAYMTNGRKLIGELGELAPKQVFFRAVPLRPRGW